MLRVLRHRWRSGVAGLALLAVLAGCAGHFLAQREPWRKDAETRLPAIRRGEGKRHDRAGRADQRPRHVRRGFSVQGCSARRQRDARLFRRSATAGRRAECRSAALAGHRRLLPARAAAARRSARRRRRLRSRRRAAIRQSDAARLPVQATAADAGNRRAQCRRAAADRAAGSNRQRRQSTARIARAPAADYVRAAPSSASRHRSTIGRRLVDRR